MLRQNNETKVVYKITSGCCVLPTSILKGTIFKQPSVLIFSFLFFEGLTSDFACSPDSKQKFCTRLARPGANARVSGPECYAPPHLGSPAFLITGLLCTVSLKNSEKRARLLYSRMTVNLAVFNHSKLFVANEMFQTRVCVSIL